MKNLSKILILWGSVLAGAQAQDGMDGLAAIVNQEVITFSDVRKEVDPIESKIRIDFNAKDPLEEVAHKEELVAQIREARIKALDDLIERRLIVQEFKRLNYKMPKEVIEERIDEIVKSQYNSDRVTFLDLLENNGLTIDEYRQEIGDQFVVGAMRNEFVSKPAQLISRVPEEFEREHGRIRKEWVDGLRKAAFVKIF